MPQVRSESRTVDHAQLARFCAGLLVAAGLDAADAALVADSLVHANLRGVDSHGVARLPHYLRRIRGGSILPRPDIRCERLAPGAARVDGGHGLGQLVTWRATREAVAIARETGAGWVSVRNSSHCGAMAFYGLEIARQGMIGFAFTHVDPMVLPFGSAVPFCGTNPVCITAPGPGDAALCLDMATSVTPWNSVANAAAEGVAIPPDWGVDEHGKPTTDPRRIAALHAFGGYKGSGLGLMVDVLCAMLSDSPYGPDIPKMYGDMTQHRRLGGLVGAIDIARFLPLDRFHARVAELMKRWTGLPAAEPGGRVLYPGQPEVEESQRRLRDGVPIGLKLWEEFSQLAEQHRVRMMA